jgi:hypothetical protein
MLIKKIQTESEPQGSKNNFEHGIFSAEKKMSGERSAVAVY